MQVPPVSAAPVTPVSAPNVLSRLATGTPNPLATNIAVPLVQAVARNTDNREYSAVVCRAATAAVTETKRIGVAMMLTMKCVHLSIDRAMELAGSAVLSVLSTCTVPSMVQSVSASVQG